MSAIGTVNQTRRAHALAPATLACMGVVFGDIGTSPLYALSVAVKAASPDGQISQHAVLGVVSLIFWSLIVVISIKYAILIMRADNHGEGGILALLALVSPKRAKQSRWRAIMVVVGLIGVRRRLHHTGHIRTQRDRRHQGLRTAPGACRDPVDGCDSHHSIFDPAQRHGLDRRHLWAGYAD